MPGGKDLKIEVLKTSICALCGACLDWCPYIKNLEDHLVMPFDCMVQDGRCYSVCPRTFTDWEQISRDLFEPDSRNIEIGSFLGVYKAKRKNPVEGQQNGGTVTALVETALGYYEGAGVLLTGTRDGIVPEPVFVQEIAEVSKTAGSRFLASPGLRKMMEAKDRGAEKLVVVGRPCQIQAVRKIQYRFPDLFLADSIVTVGLFCMWSLDWSFKNYIERKLPGVKIQRIGIPQHGLEVHTEEGVKVIPNEHVKNFVRKGCSYCLDMTSELADISVGALEIEPEWNTLIVRSSLGKQLLELAIKGDLVVDDFPNKEFERLKWASLNKKVRNLMTIKNAVEKEELKPFIDLSKPIYQEILSYGEGQVHN